MHIPKYTLLPFEEAVIDNFKMKFLQCSRLYLFSYLTCRFSPLMQIRWGVAIAPYTPSILLPCGI